MFVMSTKPVSYIPQSPRLLDQLREVLRYKHYSLRTEEAYLYWVKFFVRWHGRNGQVRHPRELGAAEVEQFLSMLTAQRNVSVSTPNHALSALLFLYRNVLGVDWPWLTEVQRPPRPRRIPWELTMANVVALLACGALSHGMQVGDAEPIGVRDSQSSCSTKLSKTTLSRCIQRCFSASGAKLASMLLRARVQACWVDRCNAAKVWMKLSFR